MDVDNIHKYDEYVRGVPHDIITVETKIKPSNKGFAMLEKLGWTEGQPLGVSGDGRIEPIPFQIKSDLTGLGKISQDVRMIETTVSQRRGLDSERQQKETEDQRKAREESVARKSALEDELSSTLKAFYCTLCDKQFKNVAQYDEHTNSYAHHHKARFKDMQANVRLKPKDEIDKRREKERKREEKELRKIAAANGIKMAKPAAAVPIVSTDSPSPVSTAIEVQPLPPPKRGGWATISGSAPYSGARSGWTSTDSPAAPSPQSSPIMTQPPASSNPSSYSTLKPASNPTFRRAGWTSLDSTSYEMVPTNPPLPIPSASRGWSSIPSSESSSAGWSRPDTQLLTAPPSELPPNPTPIPSPPEPLQQARSGWQQFQKSNHKRR
ncbi:G patch domain-containing protein 8 [Termitomyces sp. T112]|nr:G patch domain-containing protein 8 [Termitomyces sp. T112]